MGIIRNLVFLAGLVVFFGCHRSEVRTVVTEKIRIESVSQIRPVTDSLVDPILYTNVSGLGEMPLAQAKQTFIAVILPSILVAKHVVEMERLRIQEMQLSEWSPADSAFIEDMYRKYSAKSTQELLLKIGTLPTSIVLAQAAVESGWGRSRFFSRASNVFGIWSTNVDEPRIAASRPRGKKVVYVRSYEDISESIGDYFTVLSRARTYRALRKERRQTNDPLKLLPYLKSYSERKAAYIRLLKKVIEQNDLRRFDTYKINPKYLQRT